MQTDRAASLPARMHVQHGQAGFEIIANDTGELKFWNKFNAGTWEPETLDIIEEHTGPPVHFFDIGSWIGPTALHAAAQGASVTAVEADPRALEPLRRNIALPRNSTSSAVHSSTRVSESGVISSVSQLPVAAVTYSSGTVSVTR